MKAYLRKRTSGSWAVIVDYGYCRDHKTGKLKRKQRWIGVKGTRADAESRLNEIRYSIDRKEFVEPSKRTFGEWLQHWLEIAIKDVKRERTYEAYKSIIDRHLIPQLGHILLQDLESAHLERYYSRKDLAPATLALHHSILSGSLKSALRKGYVARNEAKLVDNRPQAPAPGRGIRENCWTLDEARRFLSTAREFGTQEAAFYTLALDSGARKGELCGLRWENVDLENAQIRIVEQLIRAGSPPAFGPPKSRAGNRTIDLSAESVNRLRLHRIEQNELKMSNRGYYNDFGLTFAKTWKHKSRNGHTLGDPLPLSDLGQGQFARIVKAAEVRPITFHGLRHTSATLLLDAGVPVKVAQERLGHEKLETTISIYFHVLPSMQREAADKIGALLSG